MKPKTNEIWNQTNTTNPNSNQGKAGGENPSTETTVASRPTEVAHLDPDYPTMYRTLSHRVSELHWRWNVIKSIFVVAEGSDIAKAGRVQLLRSCSEDFFSMIWDVAFQDVVLRITKLLDDATHIKGPKGRHNLSFLGVADRADEIIAEERITEVKAIVDELQTSIVPLEKWRNRRIAHDDERVSLGRDPLAGLPLADVDACLEKIVVVTHLLNHEPTMPELEYRGVLPSGTGEILLNTLRLAEQYRRECLKEGRRPTLWQEPRG